MSKKHRYPNTCTQDNWNVSYDSGGNIKGVKLSVFKGFHNGNARYSGYNGKTFETHEQAGLFALEHGYTQIFYSRPSAFIQLRLSRRTRKYFKTLNPERQWIELERLIQNKDGIKYYNEVNKSYFHSVRSESCCQETRDKWNQYMAGNWQVFRIVPRKED